MFRRDRFPGEASRGAGRTFAAFLRAPKPEAAPVRMLDLPHRAEVERCLGRVVPNRAVYDPVGCRARGVNVFVHGDSLHFASLTPGLDVVLGALRAATR